MVRFSLENFVKCPQLLNAYSKNSLTDALKSV